MGEDFFCDIGYVKMKAELRMLISKVFFFTLCIFRLKNNGCINKSIFVGVFIFKFLCFVRNG